MSPEERAARIEQYATGPDRLRTALDQVPAEARRWRPEPSEFSVHEVVCHCADSETNAYSRIRFLLTEKDPVIVGYDPSVWAEAFAYREHPLEAALATITAVRANTVPILRRMTEADWAKVGRHTEDGHYTPEIWLRNYSNHLEEHIQQIQAAYAAWQTAHGATASM